MIYENGAFFASIAHASEGRCMIWGVIPDHCVISDYVGSLCVDDLRIICESFGNDLRELRMICEHGA